MPPKTALLRTGVALFATISLQGCTPQAPATPKPASPATAPTSVPTSPAAAATQPATRPAAVRAEVTRRDVAEALMRFETALYTRDRTPAEWAAVNRRFDAATTAFFAGGLGRVVKALDEMAWELDPATAPKTPAERAARAFKVRVEPGVLVIDDPRKLSPIVVNSGFDPWPPPPKPWSVDVVTYPMYPLAADVAQVGFTVLLTRGEESLGSVDMQYRAGQVLPLTVPFTGTARLLPGTYEVRVTNGTTAGPSVSRWAVRSDTRYEAELPARLTDQVANVPTQPPAMRNALATLKARLRVLEDWPNEDRSAVFRADPHELRQSLPAEAAQLARDENPYRRRTGDFWRVAAGGGYVIPLRVYAPAAAADDTPRPLLVVLHGMGGDENMFLDAYGQGRIKALADKYGFVVASPNAYQISGKPELFYEVLEAMTLDYAIDPKRVYVLGHSMGAMAAGRVAARPGAVAAAVLIAGPAPADVPADAAPMLLIAGDADRIVPAPRVRQSAERLKAAGRNVEYREKAGWGHTLVVPEVLPEAVEWLMSKR